MQSGGRPAVFVSLLILTLLGWLWIVPMAQDMYGTMSGTSAWMMTPVWDVQHLLLLWLMWAVMMAVMMVPSAIPLLMLYDGLVRKRAGGRPALVQTYAMAVGYVGVWGFFSVAAVVLQRILSERLLLTSMMEMSSRTAIGVTLLLAGTYQFTPWKLYCLRLCRSPLNFVMKRWRTGVAGALRMGLEHGAYCLGCCWALMLLLFAGGVMNLSVIIGLTGLVLLEKLTPIGVYASRASGAVMLAAGVWFLIR